MWKLISLEYKKNNIKKYCISAVILAVILVVFIFALTFLGIANDPGTGVVDAAPGKDTISSSIELFTSMTFLVFTGVMLASFIVSAYKDKTMNLMFSYPIKRQKILLSQMMAVWIFNFLALTATKLMIYWWIAAGSTFMKASFVVDYSIVSPAFYAQLVLKSAAIVTMGFIALFIGLAMKSSKATIISSFLLIFLTQANVGDFTMANNAAFAAVLTIISVLFAFLSISKVETKDLM